MAKPRKSLSSLRKLSFSQQNGYCYYCNQPMWKTGPKGFSKRHEITIKQAKQLQCTGEHLIAHSKEGPAKRENIVAACLYCNRTRHKRAKEISPADYKSLVVKRLQKGQWHGICLNQN